MCKTCIKVRRAVFAVIRTIVTPSAKNDNEVNSMPGVHQILQSDGLETGGPSNFSHPQNSKSGT